MRKKKKGANEKSKGSQKGMALERREVNITKLKEVSLVEMLQKLPIEDVEALTGHAGVVRPVPMFVAAIQYGHNLVVAVPIDTEGVK